MQGRGSGWYEVQGWGEPGVGRVERWTLCRLSACKEPSELEGRAEKHIF